MLEWLDNSNLTIYVHFFHPKHNDTIHTGALIQGKYTMHSIQVAKSHPSCLSFLFENYMPQRTINIMGFTFRNIFHCHQSK